MKYLIFNTLFVLLIALHGCNGENTNDKMADSQQTPKKVENVTPPTKKINKPIALTKESFLVNVMDYQKNPTEWKFKGEIPCIIDFYADWCGPCKKVAPIMEELAAEYAGKINIYKVNTQTEQELAAVFGITSIPAFLFCAKEGNPQMSYGTASTPEETKQAFKDIIEKFLINNEKNTKL